MIDIGLRIRDLREASNLTQIDFCEKIGITQPNLSHIENKGAKISVGIIKKIITNFDINANWLLTGDGEMRKSGVRPKNQTDKPCQGCQDKQKIITLLEDKISLLLNQEAPIVKMKSNRN